jgi:hypothetical protein
MPEWDPVAAQMRAHNRRAPEEWDQEDHASSVWSKDDKSMTSGDEELQFLADGELESESEDDSFSWDGYISSEEEEEEDDDTDSLEDYPPAKRFRAGSDDDDDDDDDDDVDDEDDEAPPGGRWSSDEEPAGSSADESSDDDEGSNGP